MGFIYKHKFLILLVLLGLAYFRYNPSGKFGMQFQNITVFDRVPITFFDLYINPRGRRKIIENISDERIVSGACRDIKDDLDVYGESGMILLVGTGTGKKLFSTHDFEDCRDLHRYGDIRELDTERAMVLYNTLVDSGVPVAAIMKLRED